MGLWPDTTLWVYQMHTGFLELQKVKAQTLLKCDRNLLNLFGTGGKLPKDSGKTNSVKYLSQLWCLWTKNMSGVTDNVEILHTAQLDQTTTL